MGGRERAMKGSPVESGTYPRAGVGVLLVDQSGRVLLTLRKLSPEADCWSIVGGKLDFLESLAGISRPRRERRSVEL